MCLNEVEGDAITSKGEQYSIVVMSPLSNPLCYIFSYLMLFAFFFSPPYYAQRPEMFCDKCGH